MAGEVIAVASGKGGVGKTTTVVNLGVVLRRADHTVALVDGDLGMANLGRLLGIDASTTLHDVLAGEATVEEAIVEEAPGFGVLAGSGELSSYPDAEPSGLRDVLETLAADYEFVLVDTGAGMSHEDVLPLGLADRVVLVTTPEPASIGDTQKTAELADLADGTIAGLVVTMADDGTDGRHIARQVGVELLGVVPYDPAVRESTASATPLEALDPDGPAAAAYRELAATLSGESIDTSARSPEPGEGPRERAGTEPPDEPGATDDASAAGDTDAAGAPVDDGTAAEPAEHDGAGDAEGGSRGLLSRLGGLFG
ncbi:MAG: MinD/ParA family protein [Halobacteriales archaeon]